MAHFYSRRYQTEKSAVFPCPRVTALEPAILDIRNLKTMELEPRDVLSVECSSNSRCKGHLMETPEGKILPPSFCVVDDFEVKDQRAYACKRYREGEISEDKFAEEMRNSLKGKQGLLRNKTLGVRPLLSIRGIASCDWALEKNEVRIPRLWAKKLCVPFRRSGDNTRSGVWSFRNASEKTTEFGILLRCPIAGDSSIQAVKIKVWDNFTIGVNPAMCAPLNLDFDGDEVHVMLVSGKESVEEIQNSMALEDLTTFDGYPQLSRSALPEEDVLDDFMLNTTLSMRELERYDYKSPLAKSTKAKEPSRSSFVTLTSRVNNYDIDELFNTWETSMSNMVRSHLTVSQGHTFMRQFAVASSCIDADESNLRIAWQGRNSIRVNYEETCTIRGIKNPFETTFYGFPGARLALRLSSKVFQQLLDLAKSKGTSSDTRLMMSLFASGDLDEEDRKYYLARKTSGSYDSRPLFKVFSSPKDIEEDYILIASTDMNEMSGIYDTNEVISSVMFLVRLVMKKMGVRGSDSEVLELAALIYHATLECDSPSLTSRSVTSFLSFTSNDALTSALCDNIGVLDLSIVDLSRAGTRAGRISSRNLYTAITLGNMEQLKKRTVLRLH